MAATAFAQEGNKSPVNETLRIPATDLPFNDDTDKVQFAIISDVWGGRRPGIFEDAVAKLQLLQPQFVISVGDLTDGKTYDTSAMEKEWIGFNNDIKPLGMRFYYVPGNHDIGNPLMEKEWKKLLGAPYYHFVYKQVLFLCINTQDGGYDGIRDEQVNYFRKAISSNPGVRWIFLFMHRPVWQGKDEKEEGYEKIEALLKGHNYTLFSGHHHTYLSVMKNGNKHFVLGTTGGGSDMRGEKFGEFDHLTMVTLSRGEPKIVNLKLDGIITESVVNEITHPITQTLIDETWLNPIAVVSQHQREPSIAAEIKLANPTNYPLLVTGQLCKKENYQISPCDINLTIAPHSNTVQKITISKTDHSLFDIADIPSVDISLNGEYTYNNMKYMIPSGKKLLLSWKLIPPPLKKDARTNSGFYHNRDTAGMIRLRNPEYLGGKWYWSGAEDAFVRFKMMKDEKYVYIIALVNDDQWVRDQSAQKDLLYLALEDSKGGQNLLSVSPLDEEISIEGKGSITAKDISFKKYFTDSTAMIEFRIPISTIMKADHSARINVGYRDQDNVPEKTSATLYWKPIWGSAEDYKDSGTFLLE